MAINTFTKILGMSYCNTCASVCNRLLCMLKKNHNLKSYLTSHTLLTYLQFSVIKWAKHECTNDAKR